MEKDTRKDSAEFQQVRADGFASFNLRMDSIYRSIQGSSFFMKGENDGVVSEADPRIKKSTASFKHLLHEHTEILEQAQTVARETHLETLLRPLHGFHRFDNQHGNGGDDEENQAIAPWH